MASQVLSGSSNPSYTNNTGQNVRVLINYMASCTSMTWAGVTVTTTSTTISKNNLQIQTREVTVPINGTLSGTVSAVQGAQEPIFVSANYGTTSTSSTFTTTAYVPTTVGPSANLPVEIILAPSQSFSAVSDAYNIVVIKEDGT